MWKEIELIYLRWLRRILAFCRQSSSSVAYIVHLLQFQLSLLLLVVWLDVVGQSLPFTLQLGLPLVPGLDLELQ